MSTVANSNSGSTSTIFEMEGFLADVLGKAIGAQGEQANAEQASSEAILENQIQNTQNMDDQIHKQEHEGFFKRLFTDIAYVAVGALAVFSFATGDEAMGVLLTVMLTAQITGGMGKAADEVSKALQSFGVPEDVANVLADAMLVMLSFAMGAGIASALSDTAVAVEAGTEIADAAVTEGEEAMSAGTGEVGEDANSAEKTKSSSKKTTGSGLLAASTATSQVAQQFAQSFSELVCGSNGKDQHIIDFLVEITLIAASAAGGFAGGSMAMGSTGSDAMKTIKGSINAAQAVSQMGSGSVDIAMSVTTLELSKTLSQITLLNGISDLNKERLDRTNSRSSQIIDEFGKLERDNDFFQGNEAAAYAMA